MFLAYLPLDLILPTNLFQPTVLRISVRDLVSFALHRGNLHPRRFGLSTSALEGIWGHQRIQRSRPEDYQAEVGVKTVHDYGPFSLEISGRIDGVFKNRDPVIVEEIKTTRLPLTEISPEATALHMGQAKLYGALFARQKALDRILVRLTYLNVDSNKTRCIEEDCAKETLDAFFDQIIGDYLKWAELIHRLRTKRDPAITALGFPFPRFRAGQRRLAAGVYRAIRDGKTLFIQAPTGIGKSMGTLFPALKALAEGHCRKLFYLTAKTPGAMAAEQALHQMRDKGLALTSVTLTARDKMCREPACDTETCPLAIGYYDRIREALAEGLERGALDREQIRALGEKHQVCPFEYALDLAFWCDLVICDFNYAFDPGAYLRRFFSEGNQQHVLLIDEAHNLVDRARAMYSAHLSKALLLSVKRSVKGPSFSALKGAIESVNRAMLQRRKQMTDEVRIITERPEDLIPVLQRFCKRTEEWAATHPGEKAPEPFRDLYYQIRTFLRAGELFHEAYVTIERSADKDLDLRLYCRDPSKLLTAFQVKSKACVFFSATLMPFDYFSRLSTRLPEPGYLRLPSPFPTEHLCTLIAAHISTRFHNRAAAVSPIVDTIATVVAGRVGNYLVFLPSHAYLATVAQAFSSRFPHINTLVQEPDMDENQRGQFLGRFQSAGQESLVGFAVMGGIFGEGIDLAGDRLIGVVVVGVGLPALSLERDLIRDYFDRLSGEGFDYAYQYPGLHRVLQAAGRVIRNHQDRGVVCLIGDRFLQTRFRRALPVEWRPRVVKNCGEIQTALAGFWASCDGG